jgi:hypothetical protein
MFFGQLQQLKKVIKAKQVQKEKEPTKKNNLRIKVIFEIYLF